MGHKIRHALLGNLWLKFLPLVIKDYRKWADMVKFTLGAIVIISITVPAATAIIKHRRDKKMALEL